MPPDNSIGKRCENVVGETDEPESPTQLGKRVVVVDTAGVEQLADHPADLPRRVERAHRVLGHDRDLVEPVLVHPGGVRERQLDPVEDDLPADMAHAALQPDQALSQGRLAAARLTREPHDLAVGDRERDAVERLHVTAERAVVDLEIVDFEAHVSRSFGLKTSSSPTFIT